MIKNFKYGVTNIREYMEYSISRLDSEDLENIIYDYLDENDSVESLRNINNINEFCKFYMALVECVNRTCMDLDLIKTYELIKNYPLKNITLCNKQALSFVLVLNNILYGEQTVKSLESIDSELYKEAFVLVEVSDVEYDY